MNSTGPGTRAPYWPASARRRRPASRRLPDLPRLVDGCVTHGGDHLTALRQITVNGSGQTTEDADFHVRLASVARNQFLESIMVSIRPHILFGLNISKTLPAASRRKHSASALKESYALTSRTG